MATADYRGRQVTLTFNAQEFEYYERLVQAAELRDMDTASLLKSVLIGAVARGGSTVDTLVTAGSKFTVTKRRARRNPRRWELVGDQTWASGPWRLYTARPSQASRGSDNQDLWWHLINNEDPDVLVPLAFKRKDADRLADDYIHDYEKRKAEADGA